MFDYEKFNEYMKRKFPESMSDWWVQQLVENLAQWIMETCEGIEKNPERSAEMGVSALLSIIPDLEEEDMKAFFKYEEKKVVIALNTEIKTIYIIRKGEVICQYQYLQNPNKSAILKEMIKWRHFYEDKGYEVEYNFRRKE